MVKKKKKMLYEMCEGVLTFHLHGIIFLYSLYWRNPTLGLAILHSTCVSNTGIYTSQP